MKKKICLCLVHFVTLASAVPLNSSEGDEIGNNASLNWRRMSPSLEMTIRFTTSTASQLSEEELLDLDVPKRVSRDVDMDPCKAGSFVGDIAMPTEAYEVERDTRQAHWQKQTKTKRAATARPERIWDYAVIPYEIDANFSGGHKSLFKQVRQN